MYGPSSSLEIVYAIVVTRYQCVGDHCMILHIEMPQTFQQSFENINVTVRSGRKSYVLSRNMHDAFLQKEILFFCKL